MSRFPKKIAALTAATALMAPVGVAQATHDTGKAGAPGQKCKTELQAKKSAEGKAARKAAQQAYKACIKAAATARSAH